MRRVRQFRTFFLRPDAREAASTVAQAELAVIETVAIAGTLSWTRSFLAITAVADGVRLSGRTLVRFGKISRGSQMSNKIGVCGTRKRQGLAVGHVCLSGRRTISNTTLHL